MNCARHAQNTVTQERSPGSGKPLNARAKKMTKPKNLSPLMKKLLVVKGNMNYRAKRRGQFDNIQVHQLITLIKNQGMNCHYCGREVRFYEDNRKREDAISFDHKTPMCKGGTNTIDNLVISCLKCNRERNHKDQKNNPPASSPPTAWVVYVTDPYKNCVKGCKRRAM